MTTASFFNSEHSRTLSVKVLTPSIGLSEFIRREWKKARDASSFIVSRCSSVPTKGLQLTIPLWPRTPSQRIVLGISQKFWFCHYLIIYWDMWSAVTPGSGDTQSHFLLFHWTTKYHIIKNPHASRKISFQIPVQLAELWEPFRNKGMLWNSTPVSTKQLMGLPRTRCSHKKIHQTVRYATIVSDFRGQHINPFCTGAFILPYPCQTAAQGFTLLEWKGWMINQLDFFGQKSNS